MSSVNLTGSPSSKMTSPFVLNVEDKENEPTLRRAFNGMPIQGPLAPSKMVNQLPVTVASKMEPESVAPKVARNPVDELLARITEQQARNKNYNDKHSSESSFSVNTDPYAGTNPTDTSEQRPDAAEVFHLKKELEMARDRMAQMDIQLTRERDERVAMAEMDITQSQMARQTVENAIGSPYPTPQALHFNAHANIFRGRMSPLPNFTPQSMSEPFSRPTSSYGSFQTGYTPPITPVPFQQQPYGQSNTYRMQPLVSSRPAHTGMDFSVGAAAWNGTQQSSNYMSLAEPLNYRRLLDRTMSCNWKYIVDKIVCSNDQQASIFLQQKLKVGTTEQKFEIVQAIIDQAYPLMINRFGNFLVQRCFEHGTPEQVVAIAQAIRGNTLNLSMDAFGCHVVQKAFDCVPEEYKAIMVHELLRRIPETVIHRYACHVWQKLFELRWSDTPPQIMKYVNEALRGMWHEVALGETGSLVVQNIFENCLEEDKRPCITEVLASIDVVAHGQFGNWCIQHICEHGAIPDRTRAIDHVLRFATEYSMDQFASKVVEKCLKVGGTDFLDRYLHRVCEALPDRPRMPLIDISGDQFGNYLIQYILSNADAQRREIVATHIRKHMVSLRGSKYGSRVAMLCCNPAHITRPGPPNGLAPGRFNGRFNDNVIGGERAYANEAAFAPRMSRGGYSGFR